MAANSMQRLIVANSSCDASPARCPRGALFMGMGGTCAYYSPYPRAPKPPRAALQDGSCARMRGFLGQQETQRCVQ